MNSTMTYKGYTGSVEFSEEDAVFYGKVLGVHSLISYEGESARRLIEDFHGAVDDYLTVCASEGREPERAPHKGSSSARIPPELRRQAAMAAADDILTVRDIEKEG